MAARYVKECKIPVHNQWKLDKELDWDNGYGRDVNEIAKYLNNWQANLSVRLELNKTDIARVDSVQGFLLKR